MGGGSKKGGQETTSLLTSLLALVESEFFLDAVEHELEHEGVDKHKADEDASCKDLVGEEGADGKGEHAEHVDSGKGLACDFHVGCGVGFMCHDVPSSFGVFPLI